LPFEEARNSALKRMTETYRPFLHASWLKARVDYNARSADLRFDNGIDTSATWLQEYHQVRTEYEQAVSEYDKVIGPVLSEDQSREFEAGCNEYTALLGDGGLVASSARVQTGRERYERLLEDYSRAIARVAGEAMVENGEVLDLYLEARASYEDAVRTYEEAERAYEEKHQPYEQAVAAAERLYEEKRRERVRVVEEVREQFEKSPDLYQRAYEEVVTRYQAACAEERVSVIAAGGLHIIGTERHEARRIDNQLRGRAGRQGDPGSSRFYLSLEDDLLRIFGAERIQKVMDRLGMEEGEPIEHGLVTRAIEKAQQRVEAHNFDIRKHLLEYDDVMNKQREVIYQQRRSFLAGDNLKVEALSMVEAQAEDIVGAYANRELPPEEWDWNSLSDALFRQFNARLVVTEKEREDFTPERLLDLIHEKALQAYEEKERTFTAPVMRYLEKMILLQSLDGLWKDHLLSLDHLKEGIGLRSYAQKNPLQEYQKEAFALFEGLSQRMQEDVVEKLYTVQIARQEEAQRIEPKPIPQQRVMMSHGDTVIPVQSAQLKREAPKVGRNDPCPCGSGKKFKKCHGV
jgi:preprotein translocase subunit SecA